jgi:cbb3-type cytochrome oxidase cytochrome c subunit
MNKQAGQNREKWDEFKTEAEEWNYKVQQRAATALTQKQIEAAYSAENIEAGYRAEGQRSASEEWTGKAEAVLQLLAQRDGLLTACKAVVAYFGVDGKWAETYRSDPDVNKALIATLDAISKAA